MKPYALGLALLIIIPASSTFAQKTDPPKSNGDAKTETKTIPAPPPITDKSTPIELARAALAALGGDNFKKMKSSFIVGSANLYAPNQAQSIPGTFAIATAGEKVRVDINAQPIIVFKQVYDGVRSTTTIPGIEIPPPSKFGLPVLAKFDQSGYTLSAIPDKKKLRGFRIVDADGNTTDYYIDPATARVSEYVIPYQGYTFGSTISKFAEVDGVLVPMNFTQRFEMPGGGGAYFADYKVKSVKINGPIGDDVFVIQ
ncbi:MAG TPA: hypothetical protein VE863_07775 [Pyrinomonadaceae bacterium]|nr:hypothetical protein [Pyrinomonadaceae bacterium]